MGIVNAVPATLNQVAFRVLFGARTPAQGRSANARSCVTNADLHPCVDIGVHEDSFVRLSPRWIAAPGCGV